MNSLFYNMCANGALSNACPDSPTHTSHSFQVGELLRYKYPPPCLCARSWRVVTRCRVLLPETLYRNYWRSGRATAQNKSLKVTILRGYRNPEIENSHPSAAESLLLAKMCVLCRVGTRAPVLGRCPRGEGAMTAARAPHSA